MFLKNLDLIVDVETIGIFAPYRSKMIISNAVFNVGIVLQYKGEVLLQENIGIREFWEYPEHRIMDFYRKNFVKEDFTVMYDTFEIFLNKYFYPLLKSFYKQANIKLYSYNADFDRRAFIDTALLENHKIPTKILNNWQCLMVLSNKLLEKTPQYLNWCVEQQYDYPDLYFITPKGNVATKAETVYRYITQNPHFVEEHKGMQDAQIEGQILEFCKLHKGWSKIDTKPRGGGWQIFNKAARPFQKISHLDTDNTEIWEQLTISNQNKLHEILNRRRK